MKRHGQAPQGRETPAYRSWVAMIQRCYDPGSTVFGRYGGRGIIVCDRWRFGEGGFSGFECFFQDMGERPTGKSLDRDDANGNYEPGHCKWSTAIEQARNRRSTRWVLYGGIEMSLAEAVERSCQKPDTVKRRLIRGWPLSRAVGGGCVDAAAG